MSYNPFMSNNKQLEKQLMARKTRITGRPPIAVQVRKSERIGVRLDGETADKLRETAKAQGISISDFIRIRVLEGIDNQPTVTGNSRFPYV